MSTTHATTSKDVSSPFDHLLDLYATKRASSPSVLRRCPRRPGEWLDRRTGELVGMMCGANFCGYCGWHKARQVAVALAASAPTHWVTLTQVGDDPGVIRHKFAKLIRQRLTRLGYEYEAAHSVECNKTTLTDGSHEHHIHVLLHGSRIPPADVWAEVSVGVGFGAEVHFDALYDDTGAARYVVKEARERVSRQHHLDMNRGRVVGATRGFWRHRGAPMKGWKKAWQAEVSSTEPSASATTAPTTHAKRDRLGQGRQLRSRTRKSGSGASLPTASPALRADDHRSALMVASGLPVGVSESLITSAATVPTDGVVANDRVAGVGGLRNGRHARQWWGRYPVRAAAPGPGLTSSLAADNQPRVMSGGVVAALDGLYDREVGARGGLRTDHPNGAGAKGPSFFLQPGTRNAALRHALRWPGSKDQSRGLDRHQRLPKALSASASFEGVSAGLTRRVWHSASDSLSSPICGGADKTSAPWVGRSNRLLSPPGGRMRWSGPARLMGVVLGGQTGLTGMCSPSVNPCARVGAAWLTDFGSHPKTAFAVHFRVAAVPGADPGRAHGPSTESMRSRPPPGGARSGVMECGTGPAAGRWVNQRFKVPGRRVRRARRRPGRERSTLPMETGHRAGSNPTSLDGEGAMMAEHVLAYRINEVHDIAPWGRSMTYKLVRTGQLPAHKLGSATLVLREDLERFVRELPLTRVQRSIRIE